MAVNAWKLVFYQTVTGRRPVRDYLDDLRDDERAKVSFDLDLLATFGLDLGAQHVRSVRGKLWELRATGQSQHRVLYFGKRLVLLHAFTKKTRKTPPPEIETALRRMADYLERTGR